MEVYCVIPASVKNRYSQEGDLVTWGDTTLIEWKISQIREVANVAKIFVSTSSSVIAQVVSSYGVEIISRRPDLTLPEIYRSAAEEIGNKLLLWTNPTSPFLGPKSISIFIKNYLDSGQGPDGAATVKKFQEFIFDLNGPFNFSPAKEAFTRTDLEQLYILTNGAYLIPSESLQKWGRPFGTHPYSFEVDWLSSLEIRDANQMRLFPGLLARYFEGEF